jgi:hypothetical protein
MDLVWKWALVAVLAFLPAIVAGPMAGIAVGLHYQLPLPAILVVVTLVGFGEGLLVIRLSEWAEHRPRIAAWLARQRSERAVRIANRWGRWVGLLVGTSVAGQEPMILALTWLNVPKERLFWPILLTNVLYAGVYYYVVRAGLASWDLLYDQLEELKMLLELQRR